MDSAQDTLSGGLPHSEIPGSTIARISPGLFAACHVLHRLSVPRHPPDALLFALERHTKRQSPRTSRKPSRQNAAVSPFEDTFGYDTKHRLPDLTAQDNRARDVSASVTTRFFTL